MNNILQLKGNLNHRPNTGRPGPPRLPKNAKPVTSTHLRKLLNDLKDIQQYWNGERLIKGILIDVHYIGVMAKSNRISAYLKNDKPPNESVVGARFDNTDVKNPKHVITHYVMREVVRNTVTNIENSIKILDEHFSNGITEKCIEEDIGANGASHGIEFLDYAISKSNFLQIIVDSYYIKSFGIPHQSANPGTRQVVTLYATDEDMDVILRNIGIASTDYKMFYDTNTMMLLQPKAIELLQNKAPYLIAMALEDINNLSLEDFTADAESGPSFSIDMPADEPVIGVIDTLFDKSVYFGDWVEYHDKTDPEIPEDDGDYRHGTAVSSIIVDGPQLNPALDDGCGRFRVRHFGVAKGGKYSSFSVMNLLKEIVSANPDIKVWNLSLGSPLEVHENFISPEASVLDRLQFENDIIFVIAGTNKLSDDREEMLIGAPADSINAIVVNSVDSKGNPASYSRRGRVLSFFNKPDVSTFGGDGQNCETLIQVCESTSCYKLTAGTSFAAPWIARKLAYLTEVLGLSREVAKALIVDAAADWNDTGNNSKLAPLVGHGVVPRRIENIVRSKDHEIKFVINGESLQYDTYTYSIPVPVVKGEHTFVAKATLCYFPDCSFKQGVDYTNTELDVSLGRFDPNKGIRPINKNMQNVEGHYTYEAEARKSFRKWDNTKHIREQYGEHLKARKVYSERGMWGISVKAKERLGKRSDHGIKFGLVVTLKEIKGVNRIYDFKQKAQMAGWLVSEIDIDVKIDIYHKLQEELIFE